MTSFLLETQWIWIVATHISLAGICIYHGEKDKWEETEFPVAETIILGYLSSKGLELGGELKQELDQIKKVSRKKKIQAKRNAQLFAVAFVISLMMIGVSV